MDFQRDYETPLDRLDEEMLLKVLTERFERLNENDYNSEGCSKCGCGETFRSGNVSEARCSRTASPTSSCSENTNEARCGRSTTTSSCAINSNETRCGRSTSPSSSCNSCSRREERSIIPGLRGLPLAMVYSPHQEWENLYEAEIGFEHGTIFKDLDFPFYPTACFKRNNGCRNR